MTTSRSGAPPPLVQKDWLFDYTQARATDVSVTASIRQTAARRVFEVRSASFSLPDRGLQAVSLEGRIDKSGANWTLSGMDLSLDTTRIRGRASLKRRMDNDRTAFTLDLNRSRIDHDELRALVPRLPLTETTTIEGTLRGTRNRLQADGVTVTHNSSFLTVDGTLRNASPGLAVNATLTKSRLRPKDVQDVWPGLPVVHTLETGPVSLTGAVRGTTSTAERGRRPFDLSARLAARSAHGTVQGSLRVARGLTTPLTYSATLDTDHLNLAPITGLPTLSSDLTGHVEIRGTGTGTDTLQSTLSVSLKNSQLAGRPLASVDGDVTLSGTNARGSFTLRQQAGGVLTLKGSAKELDGRPSYSAVLTSSTLNLAPLANNLPRTALNARLTLRATGTEWRPLEGTLVANVDSSTVYRGDSTLTLPPHSAKIQLADRSASRPRLEISGSVATLTVGGTSLGPPLWTTGRTWTLALRNAIQQERNKYAPSHPLNPLDTLTTGPDRSALLAKNRAALADLESAGPLEAQATFRIHQPQILNAWWAAFPRQAEEVEGQASLTVGTDSLHASGRVSAAQLKTGSQEVDSLRARFELSSRLGAPLAQSTQVTASLSAQRVMVGGPPLLNASASLSYKARSGTLRFTADSVGIAESLRVIGDLNVTPRKNELRLRDVSLNIQGSEWTNQSPASLLAYTNALVVTPLVLRRPHPQTPSLQRLRVGGTLSARTTDTLSVVAENVYLPPFSQAIGLPHPIGGDLSGQIHLRSGWGEPELAGNLSVRRLSYDRRVLGDAHLHASYAADSPDLRLNGALTAEVTSLDSLAGPDLLPKTPRSVDPNRLSLEGRIRLPNWAQAEPYPRSSALPAGQTLNLSVQINRADLFFFRYIFEESISRVRGYATGSLHIRGRYRDPVFDASLRIQNGAVSLPQFGLHYQAEGPIEVDERGIHPRGFSVKDEAGTATINGSILFNDYQYFSFDLSATLDGLTVIDVDETENLPFYGSIRGSGPLQLTGPLSNATLRSNSARTTPDSELYIPVSGKAVEKDTGFIVFADSTGEPPDVETLTRRENILADRPEGVPTFVQGLNLDLNVIAPDGSTVNLVFDPIVGDVVTVVGSGRVQLQREGGDFSVYGNFSATDGTYLFTAGEVFVRRFSINKGTITWDGDPTNARLDLNATYQTRASPKGLPGFQNVRGRIPVTVQLHITGRVATPQVDLSLSLTNNERSNLIGSESLNAILNQPAQTTEYATSVLLTNTFLLTTESITQGGGGGDEGSSRLTTAGNQLAFNSVSQLVSSQLNRYLGKVLPNVDLNFGLQGQNPNNLDLIYGVALRLLNERLIVRGEGVYTGNDPDAQQAKGPQGEFVIEVRLSSRVSANVFYRRTGDELTRNRALTSSRGAGLSYQTQFSNWRTLFHRLFGWLLPDDTPSTENPPSKPVARSPSAPADSIRTSGAQR
ncbi:MAG: translocation/assembly module TamB domain-containing protein [Salinibacter sp.]